MDRKIYSGMFLVKVTVHGSLAFIRAVRHLYTDLSTIEISNSMTETTSIRELQTF